MNHGKRRERERDRESERKREKERERERERESEREKGCSGDESIIYCISYSKSDPRRNN